jgi:hypothetical protein
VAIDEFLKRARLRAFLLAVFVAGAVAVAASAALPRELRVSTDIVGYPIFHDFNIYLYLQVYYLAVLVFPISTMVFFLLFSWAARRLRWWPPDGDPAPQGSIPANASAAADSDPRPTNWIATVATTLCVGLVFGLELGIARGDGAPLFWLDVAGSAALYLGLTILVGGMSARLGLVPRHPRAAVAGLNSLAAPLAVLGLLGASGATTVAVISDGSVNHYRWLPGWVALAATVILVAWVTWRLRRAGSPAAAESVARGALLAITLPVALFLLTAAIPGALGKMDVFHEGENLAAGQLVRQGFFPWRDIISAHGLLQDVVRPLVGMLVFQNSRWGAAAGSSMLVSPLCLLAMYALFVYLFRHNWPFLVLTLVAIVGGVLVPALITFTLWPLVLLLLAAVLNRPGVLSVVAFSLVLALQTVLTPESAYAIPACAIAVIGYELTHLDRERGLLWSFRRTVSALATGVVVGAALLLFLAAHNAAGDLVQLFLTFSRSHELTGGLPVQFPPGPFYTFAALVPPVAIIASLWYLGARAYLRRALPSQEWVMVAALAMTVLYYQKFLSRADQHVLQSFAVAVPLIFYVAFKVVSAFDLRLARSWGGAVGRRAGRHTVTLALLVVVLLVNPATLRVDPGALAGELAAAPAQYRATARTQPWLDRLGYSTPDAIDPQVYGDVRAVLAAYLRPGDRLYDFSNEPGLFYYLLPYLPATRYYNVSLAIPLDSQRDLVAELRKARPQLVVFDDDSLGLPVWDNISNPVRHYAVSQYILDNYRPFLRIAGHTILEIDAANLPAPASIGVRLSRPPISDGILFVGHACEWGYAPNFLNVRPEPVSNRAAVDLQVTPAGAGEPGGSATGRRLLAPPGLVWSDYRWLEMDARGAFRQDTFRLSDQVATDAGREISFRTLDNSPARYLVPVGSCAAWHGYSGAGLVLSFGRAQDIAAVRLLP